MPTKAKSSKVIKELPVETPPTQSKAKSKPSLGLLKRINLVHVLFFFLSIAIFLIGLLIGILVTQMHYINKGTTVAANNIYAGDPAAAAQPAGPVDVDEGHLPILGNKDAKVTIVEFSDFQCPFCKSLYDDALPQIKKEYIDTGKAKFAFRQYPLSSLHPNAQKAAEASECANDQGKFWEYHDQLFENQADWEALTPDEALNKFAEYANAIGINGEELRSCVSSDEMAKKVQEDLDAGTKVGVDGTPASFVNGILISGAVPFSEFKAQIDAALKEAE